MAQPQGGLGYWPALGESRGTVQAVTAFMPSSQPAPPLSLSHILEPPHPLPVPSIPTALGPWLPSSTPPSLPHLHFLPPTTLHTHLP